MNVAIIGAGISGLSCAFELRKHGIIPHIYDKRPRIGHPLENTITTFNLLELTPSDPLKIIQRKFGLSLLPLYTLKKVKIKSTNKTATLRGNLGYAFKRGSESYSLENQIYAQTGLTVEFNSFVDIHKIKDQYDAIVVATGDDSIPRQLGLWSDSFTVFVRSATVLGDFTPGTMEIYLDANASKICFIYLLPVTAKEACILFTVNDSMGHEAEYYWKEFLFTREIQYKIIETRDCIRNIGSPHSLKTPDNIYFTGNPGGFIDDLMGFSFLSAIKSGIYAAQSIALGKKYSVLTKHLTQKAQEITRYRRTFNTFNNEDINELTSYFDMHGITKSIYRSPLFCRKDCIVPPDLSGK